MRNREGSQDLPQLLDRLTTAVTALDAVGADAYRDVFLYVSAYRGSRALAELAIEGENLWLSSEDKRLSLRTDILDDDEANRRAMLLVETCFLAWFWQLEICDLAGYLGCGPVLLERWITQARDAGEPVPSLPSSVMHRIRRLVVVEHERTMLGVPDDEVVTWLREARPAFGGRSILRLLIEDGEQGFRCVQLWLLNLVAAPICSVH